VTRVRGSALIVVLLLLSLLIVLTAEIGLRSATDARNAENQLTELQAQAALQGALVHAWGVLGMDARADDKALNDLGLPKADWPGEAWAQPVTDQPLGDGTYGFTITDESARHNLNRLLDGSGAQIPAEQERLRRLLTASCPGLDTGLFLEALGDWMDKDLVGNYETGFLPPLAVPPRNLPLLTTKELFLVPTATTELLLGLDGRTGLLPKVSCWAPPVVNVNTASAEVLYAVSAIFSSAVWPQIQAGRPFRTLSDLDAVLGGPPPPEVLAALTVRSDLFRISMRFTKGSDTRSATAVMARGGPQVVRVWWDPDPLCP
jgi:type II secretory pathway component PulK